jgi:hypothetical protein
MIDARTKMLQVGWGVALEIQKSQARRDLRRPFLVFSATCAPLIHDF